MSVKDRRAFGVQTKSEAQPTFSERAEKELQSEIRRHLSFKRASGECEFINPAMCRKSELPIGWPDFSIFLPGGRVLLVECKTATGKLRPEQTETKSRMDAIGHEVHIVRKIEEFLAVFRSFQS